MVKTRVFKKIAALTAAITLVGSFAVGAGAVVIVSTTTSYVAGSDNAKVSVTANVSGVGSSVEVTYYATNTEGDVVYVDQDTANAEGSATFNYVTEASNLKSNVKVGYTDATAAETSDITGYTVTCGDESQVVPTTNEGGAFVFNYAMPEGQALDTVEATNTSVTNSSYADGKITVVLGTITGDVTLTVKTKDATVTNPTGSYVQGAAIVSEGTDDTYENIDEDPGDISSKAGDRKLTVIGKVSDSNEYGIIISETAITAGAAALPDTGVYKAKGKNAEGYFAVQLIDTADAASTDFIKADTPYYTAIYYKTDAGYEIVAGTTVTAESN